MTYSFLYTSTVIIGLCLVIYGFSPQFTSEIRKYNEEQSKDNKEDLGLSVFLRVIFGAFLVMMGLIAGCPQHLS